jgi:hypothetical protein
MSCDKNARMIIKQGSGVPTIPLSADHRDGTWIMTDIYEGEQYLDTDTGLVYTRNGSSIIVSGQGQQYIEIDVLNAECLNITTPVNILPTPGVGKYYKYFGTLEHIFGTTAFTVSGGGDWYLNQGSKDYYFSRLIFTQTENAASCGTFYGFAKTNTKLDLTSDSDPTLGDGTARLKLWYSIEEI